MHDFNIILAFNVEIHWNYAEDVYKPVSDTAAFPIAHVAAGVYF